MIEYLNKSQRDIVSALEAVLEAAKRGEVTGFHGVLSKDETMQSVALGSIYAPVSLIGTLEVLKIEIIDAMSAYDEVIH